MVVICCALGYGLPDISGDYSNDTHPYAMQYLLPITHIAVMSSQPLLPSFLVLLRRACRGTGSS